MPARRLDDYLDELPGLKGLRSEALRLATMQRTVTSVLPADLAASVRVSRHASGALVIAAESGALAAKIRQLAPRLLTALKNQGVEVTTIRVVAQAGGMAPALEGRPRPRLPGCAAAPLEELAGRLAPSPLRSAVLRLARRAR